MYVVIKGLFLAKYEYSDRKFGRSKSAEIISLCDPIRLVHVRLLKTKPAWKYKKHYNAMIVLLCDRNVFLFPEETTLEEAMLVYET